MLLTSTCTFNLAIPASSLLTREFELVNRRFELVTREFELVTRGYELAIGGSELVTYRFEIITRKFEVVTCSFELVTRVYFSTKQASFNIYKNLILSFPETDHKLRIFIITCCENIEPEYYTLFICLKEYSFFLL